ncbi:hypothetical protein [Aquiflexum lacus]|uniref:hypothetical protein n=1 Tax=Aquiflexum lacus TaxID=2483805 RepID=UPI001892E4A9|nr:hypothetical protein [Aquiflexum lacus]
MTFSQMLKIEMYKLQRFDFYLFAGLYLLLIIAIPFGVNSIFGNAISYTEAVRFMHLVSIKLMLFGTIIATSREYTNQVNRKRLLNGYKRHQLFLSQLITVGLYVSTIMILSLLAIPILAMIVGGFSGFLEIPWIWYAGLMLSNIAWGLFAVFLVNVFKKPLWAILAYFGLSFIEIPLKFVGQFQMASGGKDNMVYFAQMDLFNKFQTFEELNFALVIALIVYLLLYQFGSLLIIKRRDF